MKIKQSQVELSSRQKNVSYRAAAGENGAKAGAFRGTLSSLYRENRDSYTFVGEKASADMADYGAFRLGAGLGEKVLRSGYGMDAGETAEAPGDPGTAFGVWGSAGSSGVQSADISSPARTPEEFLLATLRQLLARLLGWTAEGYAEDGASSPEPAAAVQRSSYQAQRSTQVVSGFGASSASAADSGMMRLAQMETQESAFSALGRAVTEDGRVIDFHVDVEMSRSFLSYAQVRGLPVSDMRDPLMINIGCGTAQVSDQKFYFDLDADGTEEEISMTAGGTGFLAYDANGDGRIGDGSELFGTKSGDGFADLAEHDGDGNGWIDENDEIFDRLKVWYRNAEGEDILISLKEAGVGAIFLGSQETEMTLDESGQTNGMIRRTGFFLKETGEAGTVQHVDLVTGPAKGAEASGDESVGALQLAGEAPARTGEEDLETLIARLFEPFEYRRVESEEEEKEDAYALLLKERVEDTDAEKPSKKTAEFARTPSKAAENAWIRARERRRIRKEQYEEYLADRAAYTDFLRQA